MSKNRQAKVKMAKSQPKWLNETQNGLVRGHPKRIPNRTGGLRRSVFFLQKRPKVTKKLTTQKFLSI